MAISVRPYERLTVCFAPVLAHEGVEDQLVPVDLRHLHPKAVGSVLEGNGPCVIDAHEVEGVEDGERRKQTEEASPLFWLLFMCE